MAERKIKPIQANAIAQSASEVALTRRDFLNGVSAIVSGGLLVTGVAASASNLSAETQEPLRVPLQVIVVPTRQGANEILKQLTAGRSFGSLARKHSIAPSSADGGYLGEVKISGLRQEIRKHLIGLRPGQVSGAFKISGGYMIVKLLTGADALKLENTERDQKLLFAAEENVHYLVPTSGWSVVTSALEHEPKPPNWNQDLSMICQLHRHAITQGVQKLKGRVKGLRAGKASSAHPLELMAAYDSLSSFESFQGHMGNAVKDLQAEYQIARATGQLETQQKLLEKLGIDCMQRGDIQNAAKTVHIESSIVPILPNAKYRLGYSEEEAVRYFLQHLQEDPLDLEVKWLLNLVMMKLGKYPGGVPSRYLIPPATFRSKEDVGRFVNVAPALGLNLVSTAGGLIVDDFDNDGYLDVVTSSLDPCTPMHYFHNNGDGTFTDRSVETGLSKQLGGLNLIQADYNNDGWLDILVLRGGWAYPMRNSLLRNNGDGTFTDVTRESGLAEPATATQTAVWADFDNDGHLDLFVGNERAPSQLFRNKGNGTFEDVGPAAGVNRTRFTKAVVAGDYDNDGYPDFYLSNLDGANILYHNNGDGTFTDVAKKLHVEYPLVSFPAWFFDYNNDGWLDILAHSYYASDVEVVAGYLNLPLQGESSRLYRNMGNGTFQDVSKQARVDRSFMPMGSNFGDFDNDGFLDFYLGTGSPSYGALIPNFLFRNHAGEHFTDITFSSRTGSLAKGHGVAFADINNDGEVEIVERMGGATPGDKAAMLVFRTPRSGNNWITIHLVGVKSNRCAMGARIKVSVETPDGGRRSIHRVVGSGGSFGASPLQQHIGLGKAKRIEALEIWWPTSKTRQTFHDLDVNQFIEIKEFRKKVTKLERHSFPIHA